MDSLNSPRLGFRVYCYKTISKGQLWKSKPQKTITLPFSVVMENSTSVIVMLVRLIIFFLKMMRMY